MAARKLSRIVRGHEATDGAGVRLQRILGYKTVKEFDPFLMLDGFDSTNPDDYIRGFPWHPHRGIETVTYLLKGEVEHGDSLGNRGTIGELQCQWMTAGSGIVHQEMPKASPAMLGCQLWINLPGKHKMTAPAYRDVIQKDIPLVSDGNAKARVLSGTFRGYTGPVINDYVQTLYIDIELAPDTEWHCNEIPNSHTLFLYLIDGSLAADEALAGFEKKGCAILMSPGTTSETDSDEITVKAGAGGARFFLLAAIPLNEPVAWGGPIVMNTQEELELAFRELDSGTFIKHRNNTGM